MFISKSLGKRVVWRVSLYAIYNFAIIVNAVVFCQKFPMLFERTSAKIQVSYNDIDAVSLGYILKILLDCIL